MTSHRIFPPLTSTPVFTQTNEPAAPAERAEAKPVMMMDTPAPVPTPVTVSSIVSAPPQKATLTDQDAQKAVATLLEWIGEDLNRDGIKETPARFVQNWKDFFKDGKEDPRNHFKHTGLNSQNYTDMVMLTRMNILSLCEKNLTPIRAGVFIAYVPSEKIADADDVRNMVNGYAARLQTQEKLTRQIAQALQDRIQPKGVIVVLRGDKTTFTTFGTFETDAAKRTEFMAIVNR